MLIQDPAHLDKKTTAVVVIPQGPIESSSQLSLRLAGDANSKRPGLESGARAKLRWGISGKSITHHHYLSFVP
jgi:hypothetical protein